MPSQILFARYREIAQEIAARLATSSEQEVIVSSGGLAAGATAEIIRLTPTGIVSARITMLDSFARRILNEAGEYPRTATDAERRLAMRAAVAGIDDPMMETRGIAAMMERSYRDVRDSGMTLADFERRSRGVQSLRNARRTEMIVRVWKAYEKLIAHLQAVDSADVLARAASLIESGRSAVASQIIAGFYDMTGAQLRLVHALEKTGKVSAIFVPAGDDDVYTFATHFVKQMSGVSRQASVLRIKKPETHVSLYDNKEVELRAVCNSIRDLLDSGVAADRIGITTRALDPDDVRLLERFAEEAEFGVTEGVETSLPGHRIGRGIVTILRLRERNFPRGDVIDILRDGYQPRIRVDIDRLDIATRKARVSGGRSVDIRNAANDPSIEDYRGVVAELEAATSLRHIAERFRLDTELDLAAAAKIDEVAALLTRWNRHVDVETLIELLGQQGIARRPTPDARRPAVWAGDVMQFRGRSFDHVFVIRTQEATFPQRRVDDPLLPDSDRRQLGIREIGDGRDEERLLFQLLLDGAGSIHFSLAGSDTFGKILRPSRMLKGMPAESRQTGRQDSGAPSERQLQMIARSGTRSVFDGYLDTSFADAIRTALQAISPTQLEDFGECPQKFFFKHILRVEEHDDPDRELQMHHREKGKLDHTILERFYKSGAPPDGIDAIVDQAFDEEESRVPAFNRVMRAIERKTTKRNLRAFLTDDIADLFANGLRPTHFEYKFGPKYLKRGPVDHPDPFVITTHDVAIRVEGSIDRIDAGKETIRIVDYKSGKALRHVHLSEKIDRGVRLQLALYAMAVAEFFEAKSVTGAIKPLIVRGTDPEKLRFILGDSETRLRETLDLFVASMLRGAFPAFPNDDDKDRNFNACKYCPVNHSCRTRHADAERRVVLQSKDPRTLLEEMA
ncbi:MAG: PD-(D/E)XK nuclease family protein [Acidobacteriota bacterium]|nr:PD-(D/E)XK nuclease family protein [Acidobacteriota bacterium]